jgi:hypothetical protein
MDRRSAPEQKVPASPRRTITVAGEAAAAVTSWRSCLRARSSSALRTAGLAMVTMATAGPGCEEEPGRAGGVGSVVLILCS